MVDANYDRAYSAAVTAASSIIGPIIPPSIILVVYAQLASVSTGRLFLAGILPGLVMAACLSLIVFVLVRKRAAAGDPLPRASAGEILRRARDGLFALIAPAIIVGGMTLGIVTPSEAGVLAVCYSLLLGVVYRSLSFRLLVRSLHEAALFSGAILLIIAASGAFGWAVNIMQVPEAVGDAIQAVTDRPWLALLMINVGLLLLGCLEAGSAALVVVAPVLIYLGGLYGIDPVHLGIIAAINLTLGSMTPPVALSLFISARIAEVPMRRAVVASLPFFLALLMSLLIVTFVPAFSLALPNWLMGG
jgi:tripartite ATP-independent transporter DctM subunit